MNNPKTKNLKRQRRHRRVRAKVFGTSTRPRLNVFRSNKGMYIQLIDDTKGNTLVSAHSKEIKIKQKNKGGKTEIAYQLGKLLAQKAKEKNITQAVFDRGGYKYHGRVKAVADGAREGGLKI
jgi:large subunit ribosomal protein L18